MVGIRVDSLFQLVIKYDLMLIISFTIYNVKTKLFIKLGNDSIDEWLINL